MGAADLLQQTCSSAADLPSPAHTDGTTICKVNWETVAKAWLQRKNFHKMTGANHDEIWGLGLPHCGVGRCRLVDQHVDRSRGY